MKKSDTLKMVTWRVGILAALTLVGVQTFLHFASETDATPKSVSVVNQAKARASGSALNDLANPPDPKQGAAIEDIWKPAPTPAGGTSWSLLEAAKEVTRTDEAGYLVSYPLFTREQRALEGKRIKVSGWMDPLQVGSKQKRFVLLGYPPGCPFHFHAAPMQFIEVMASIPFDTDRTNVITVSGVLELTGYDEGGVFYRLWDSRPG
ncbi:hypothetical protein [uncultured Erythrobacter sp.]|uniref:hypothetical protein n=1 Tax=uncultured Erythrobacter sp. TaxID=263913 RepID=UPI00260EBAD1|nr:hypothetical protein [uncultured Erythrobacter sp.]